jgi:hypothetical protein
MTLTSCAFDPFQRKTILHCELTRILWKPTKFPRNISSLFPGGDLRSFNDWAAFRISSLQNVVSEICDGRFLTRLLEMPLNKSEVARSPNETIINQY